MNLKKILALLLALVAALTIFTSCAAGPALPEEPAETVQPVAAETTAPRQDNGQQTEKANAPPETTADETPEQTAAPIDEDGEYDQKDDVALYIRTYGKLPKNYITKKEAQALGWSGGSLEKYAPGKCIGGSRFGNYEGLLPEAPGRTYTECDIDTLGKSKRGAKRIVFSNDGLIYYTDDHYESFTLLYGEE